MTIHWHAEAVVIWRGWCRERGRELQMEVEPSTLIVADCWYWRVRDEETNVVADGRRDTAQAAKASCTRAANKYARGGSRD